MTTTGRPRTQPKAIEAKRRTGNPGKRALPKPLVFTKREHAPDPPRPLGPVGLDLWSRCWRAGPWVDGLGDVETVLVLCEQSDERAELRARLAENFGDWRTRASLRTVETHIASALGALGFTPADRARIGLDMSNVERDELEAFRERRAERHAG